MNIVVHMHVHMSGSYSLDATNLTKCKGEQIGILQLLIDFFPGHQRDLWTQQDLIMMMMMGQKYHPRMRTYRMFLYSAIVMALVQESGVHHGAKIWESSCQCGGAICVDENKTTVYLYLCTALILFPATNFICLASYFCQRLNCVVSNLIVIV